MYRMFTMFMEKLTGILKKSGTPSGSSGSEDEDSKELSKSARRALAGIRHIRRRIQRHPGFVCEEWTSAQRTWSRTWPAVDAQRLEEKFALATAPRFAQVRVDAYYSARGPGSGENGDCEGSNVRGYEGVGADCAERWRLEHRRVWRTL